METNTKPIVIFDFDCTITFSHWYWFLNNTHKFAKNAQWCGSSNISDIIALSKQVNSNLNSLDHLLDIQRKELMTLIFGGINRLLEIFDFLDYLSEYGCHLYISSRGNCSQIIPLINQVGLDQYFMLPNGIVNINAHGDPCIQGDKVEFIIADTNSLRNKYPDSHIYYIDDDGFENNIIQTDYFHVVRHNYTYFGANIGLFKDQNGLDKSQMKHISTEITGFPYKN